MKSSLLVIFAVLVVHAQGEYVPQYLKHKYGNHGLPHGSYGSSNVKTFSQPSYKTKMGGLPKGRAIGGCSGTPPSPMNAGIKCSSYSGCRAQCIPNYQFPNGETQVMLACVNGKWESQGANIDWDTLPACEPICLPECSNKGICVAPNQCHCAENFSGPQCQFENRPCLNYPPMPINAKRKCSSSLCTISCLPGHKFPDGSAITTMKCESGSWRPTRQEWVAVPDCQATCTPACLNGGNCLSHNVCQCPQDYRGPQCQYSVEECSAKKMMFNGGYNCSGSSDQFSCSLVCPSGVEFEFAPEERYTCFYHSGVFLPNPIPQCLYSDNMEVIPMGGSSNYYSTYYNTSSSSSSSSKVNATQQHQSEYSFSSQNSSSSSSHSSSDASASSQSLTNESDVEREDSLIGQSHVNQYGVAQNEYQVVDMKPKPGVCFTWGGAHFKTFDQKVYSFKSDCAHTMVHDSVDDTFSLVVTNNADCKKDGTGCYRVLKIFLQERELVLTKSNKDIPILQSGKRTLMIPGQLPGVRTELNAHYVVVSLDSVGVKIKWDTKQFVQVELSQALWNRTAGLCGNLDGDVRNEMVTKDGSVAKNVNALATSWQVDSLGDQCSSYPDDEHGCHSTGDILKTQGAQTFCNALLSDPRFQFCTKIINVKQLLDTCKWDYCACRKPNPEECACDTVNVYMRTCIHSGVQNLANWRNEGTCPMKCTGGRVYKQCATKAERAVCGSSAEEGTAVGATEDADCEEGCYCPAGMVSHENKCIAREQCPCQLRGKSFHPGASMPKDCNTCTCAGGQWVCTQVTCGARCAAIGDPHYVTFDGKRFDFMGQCSYYLVKHDNFSIEAENVACSGAISQAMNFPVSFVSGLPSCTKTVTLKMSGHVIMLKQNHEVTVDGRDVMKLPHRVEDIVIRTSSSIFVTVDLPNGVELWWDGMSRAYIDVPASFKYNTKGLCGTFNDNQKDDFLTPEDDVEQSVTAFANKWKTEEKCNDVPDRLLSHPCSVNMHNKAAAEQHCQKLRSNLFGDCHVFVDPEEAYQNCLYDMCACETKISKCLCPIVASYAQDCSAHGVHLNWRNEISECGIQCPRGQTYQVCGNACSRSCHDLATRPNCHDTCVEGCNCPEGQTLDDYGECIPVGKCGCVYEGLSYPPGYKEIRPASKALELCVCMNAVWKCTRATDAEKLRYPLASAKHDMCDASKNFEFTTCEDVEPVTCKNMHNRELVSATICHAGCQCKNGYVLDTRSRTCVKPTECPCQHGGRSYKENALVQSDCNTCKCKNGKWDCTERQCSAECSAWGDSHFQTFDGKMFDYQGQCDYILAKGTLSNGNFFQVVIQNVPCSSLGVSCSKSLTIIIGSSVQQESIHLSQDKKIPPLQIFQRFTVRNQDLFVIVEASDMGLIVTWDKGTRVYVKVDPIWKEKMKGLCGNYNDNANDDFQTPSGGFSEASAQLFGDSWKLQAYCPNAVEVTDTCSERPERKLWALKQCGVLKLAPFALCHREVPVEAFLERCVFDSCACDMGGDCECLCTALSAYAQACNGRGVPIKWRSQALCPIQCDERCSSYSPCVSTCPPETCDNLLAQVPASRLCTQDACVEGCAPKPCPPGYVYGNSSLDQCVPKTACKPICMTVESDVEGEDRVFYEGDLMEEDACHSCHCSRGEKRCKGQPCLIPETTTVPDQDDLQLECKGGWTDWINRDTRDAANNGSKIEIKIHDSEPLPDKLFLYSLKTSYCAKEKMSQIKCRSVGKHIYYKEAHNNAECSLEGGLICTGSDTNPCPDFEINIKCACEPEIVTEAPMPTTISPDTLDDCDSFSEHKEHPTDCRKYYKCESTAWGKKYLLKTCAYHMLFNPQNNSCDLPAHVAQIKPTCIDVAETTTSLPTTHNVCEPGYELDDCAYRCDAMCMDYLEAVRTLQICTKPGTKCDSGCVPVGKPKECLRGELWASVDTCVPMHDCMCRSPSGEPIKPGSIIQKGCEVCQCIDNFLTCDRSACKVEEITEELISGSHEHYSTTTEKWVEEDGITFGYNITVGVNYTQSIITTVVTPPKKCQPDMYKDLIQGDNPIGDDALTATSELGSSFAAHFARIDSVVTDISAGSWSPEVLDRNQYLQIALPQQEPIYGVVVKGSPLYEQYVTSFKILYSPDGVEFAFVLDHNKQPQLFRGSIDNLMPVKHMFHLPVEAKTVRINPQSWHNQIALRVELIGCAKVKVTTPIYEPTSTLPTPVEKCVDSMGYSEGLMSPHQVIVSSAKKFYGKEHLKLDGRDGPWHAWQPSTNSPTEFIQINFLEPRNITGFISKGGRHGWVTAFKVKYAHYGDSTWNPLLSADTQEEIVFAGNFDKDTEHTAKFPMPIMATSVKIFPVKWVDDIQVRLEMLGCYKPYPEVTVQITSTAAPTKCNMCPGVSTIDMELGACQCDTDKYWDGSTCVSKPYCPCYVNNIPYAVGTSFGKPDCSDCICKLGGVPHCNPKVCQPCASDLRSQISSTCACLCLPCGDDEVLCPTSNICIDKSAWCNGVQDCPDDEINCHSITNVTSHESVVEQMLNETKVTTVECASIKCPPGYKLVEKKPTEYEKSHAYVPTMFSTYGRKTYVKKTAVLGVARSRSEDKDLGLERPAVVDKKLNCPEWTCVSKKPEVPPGKDRPCPPAACPDGYFPTFTEDPATVDENRCPMYICNPAPNRDAVCNVTGRTFSTFDNTVYMYDICDHLLARDLETAQWSVTIKKTCDKTCNTVLTIDHEEHQFELHQDLSLKYDGFPYTVDQTKKIGSQSQAFAISQLGNKMVLFVSNRYGMWVMWEKTGAVRVGVSSNKLIGKVDGLCGYFNERADDDKRKPNGDEARTTEEFGDSWYVGNTDKSNCELKRCSEHLQNKALEMCKKVQTDVFAACSKVINMDSFLSKCMDTTCTCLEGANSTQKGEDSCRCQMLQDFVVDCMSSDDSIELIDWRNMHDCPATCEAPLVYNDCYRRRCEPTCDSISDPNVCPKMSALCFPGCYCPPGLVRKGASCIPASTCRDCECNVLPHLQYVTYDAANFTVSGPCVYVMSRDQLEKYHDEHKFQLLVTNAPCRDNAEKMCVGKITILHEGHKIHVFFDNVRNKLKLVVDSERIEDFEEVAEWLAVRQTKSKHFKILMVKIQVEVSVYFPSLGVSVKAPSHRYGGKLEGLCGDCNKYRENDMRMPDGIQAPDASELGLSWLYDKLPGGQTREQCGQVIDECPPLAAQNDPCVQLLDAQRYGQCQPVLDPGMFMEWCRKESCGSPEGACNAIGAYGRECLNSGFCVQWHSDLCPAAKCPAEMIYKPCGPSCVETCDSVLSTDASNKMASCVNVPTDGCFCPEGKVRVNSTCVVPAHCEVCDDAGHHNGDRWQPDACTSCQCVGSSLKCDKQNCPAVDAVCEYGFDAVKLPADDNQCCAKYVCVPAATSRPTCDPPQKLQCGEGQLLKLELTPDGCQRFICQCRPQEECTPVDVALSNSSVPGMVGRVDNSGCCPTVKYECDVKTCPEAAECISFYATMKHDPAVGACCPTFECLPPKEQCIVELSYAQDLVRGGERERSVYEKQKLLKRVNETWEDGPCRECACLQTKGTSTYYPTCVTSECTPVTAHADYGEYKLHSQVLPGQCCPLVKRIACLYDGIEYAVGDSWTITADHCTTEQCVETEAGIRKQTEVQKCDKNCDIGFEYEPISRQCCGICRPTGCVVNGEHVKPAGSQWLSDDHCTKYKCINNNGTMQVQSEVEVCEEISAEQLVDFLYESVPVSGKCCPKHTMKACRVGNAQFQVGEQWPSSDGDPCKIFTCTDHGGTLMKLETAETCHTTCAHGWIYSNPDPAHFCCGKCDQVACVLPASDGKDVGELHAPGEMWSSPDGCTNFSCDPHQFTITSHQEACPDVDDCAPERIYQKGCCLHCNTTILDQSQCSPQPMASIKTVGIIKVNKKDHGMCVNKDVIKNLTECVGTCHSATYFNIKTGKHDSVCSCCQSIAMKSIQVSLMCEDGYKYEETVPVPAECSCSGCANSATMLENSNGARKRNLNVV